MVVSPFEERYKTEMNAIFNEENKIRKWADVEIALAKANAEVGNIPKEAVGEIEKAARKLRLERIKEIETETHHDLMAFVKAMSEQAGRSGGYIHFGATSYDIEDTATALIFRDAIGLIEKRLTKLRAVLRHLALKHKTTTCIGRTHGQHALPTTYGMKFALYYQEIGRHLQRLEEVKKRILVGKMSGAVGTKASFEGKGSLIERIMMKRLGLVPAVITNQVIQRDRHAEVLMVLALIAATMEKIAKEIRNLQRTEIMEIAEPFGKKQVGSSAMPHKRNPHKSERICSLSRLVRANVQIALENIPLEHERDLTNSANERVIFAESFIAVDYMGKEMVNILEGLDFFQRNIENNVTLTKGLILGERLMLELTRRGVSRQDAHEFVRNLSQQAYKENIPLSKALGRTAIGRKLGGEVIKRIFDPKTYIGEAEKIVENAIKN